MNQDKAHPTPAVAVPSEPRGCPTPGACSSIAATAERAAVLEEAAQVALRLCDHRPPDQVADAIRRLAAPVAATPPSLPAAQAVEGQPTVAYMTPDEDGSPLMLFFDRKEALTYCDDGEAPIELVARTSQSTQEAEGARSFPTNTCPASRHAQQMAEAMVSGEPYPMMEEERAYCGESILSVVTSLYKARTRIAELEALAGGSAK